MVNKKKGIGYSFIIREYIKHMGGIDLLDSFLGRHHILIRIQKWTFRLFYHLHYLTIANAWILYQSVLKIKVKEGKTGSTRWGGLPKGLGSTSPTEGRQHKINCCIYGNSV